MVGTATLPFSHPQAWLMFVFGVRSMLVFFILFYLLWSVTESLVSNQKMFCQKEIMGEKSPARNGFVSEDSIYPSFAICTFNLHNSQVVLLL